MAYCYFPKYEPQEAPPNLIPDNFLSMARPQPKTKPLYRNKKTRYIYSIAYRIALRPISGGLPDSGTELITLRFQGRHPEDENTIVTTAADLETNFEIYNPLAADTPEGAGK